MNINLNGKMIITLKNNFLSFIDFFSFLLKMVSGKKLIKNLDLYFLFLFIKFYLSVHYLFKSFLNKK